MADFISDDEMQKLSPDSGGDFLTDEPMAAHETGAKEPFFKMGPITVQNNPLDVDWFGAAKDEITKPMPAGEDNPLLSASIPAEGIPAAGIAARSLFGKFAGKLGGAAESFATSPLPGKIQGATNITGQAKGLLGKLSPALPENLKKYADTATGIAGRTAAYHSPLAPVQAVSDIAKGVQGAQGLVAKGLDAVPAIASKLAPTGRTLGVGAQAGAGAYSAHNAMQKFAPVLEAAKARGGNAYATTDFLLSKTDPEYQKMKKEQRENE